MKRPQDADKEAACDLCGRAHKANEACPEPAEYHGNPVGFLKKYGG